MAFSPALDTSGDVFDDYPREELVRIMCGVARLVADPCNGREGICRDRYGNIVGRWIVIGWG